jgi:hypothetical protein
MPDSLRTGSGAALGLLLAVAAAAQEPPHVLPGVGPSHFRLEVDGGSASLESAVSVAESPTVARTLATTPLATTVASPGRLVVLLFQKSFEGSHLRGLLRAVPQAKELVAPFLPRDRAAVLTYDSHLRLHLDLTTDFDAVRRVRLALAGCPGSVLTRTRYVD